MGHTRLHCETSLRAHAPLRLDADAAHYLGKVLRMRLGQFVHVFNASDGEFLARIGQLTKKHAELRVETRLRAPAAPRLEIELCLGLSRGERMSWAIQKSTELGVHGIKPFLSARGEVKLSPERAASRMQHWRRIAIGAVEQSGGFRIPDFSEPLALERVLQAPAEADCTRLLFDPAGSAGLPDSLPGDRLQIVTGPEGGFTESELALAARCGYEIVGLGPRILRSETAPVAVLAILQHRYGDMMLGLRSVAGGVGGVPRTL